MSRSSGLTGQIGSDSTERVLGTLNLLEAIFDELDSGRDAILTGLPADGRRVCNGFTVYKVARG